MEGKGVRRVYMDYAAGCPVDGRVVKAMEPYLVSSMGNPSSVHSLGREARRALDEARRQVAELVSAENTNEMVFTSGATESINLAIRGTAELLREKGNHVITSEVEHMAVLNTCKQLGNTGFKVTRVPVDRYGMIDPSKIAEAITSQTTLVSVHYANNEVGTVQPIMEISRICSDEGILLHVDAVAAEGKMVLDVQRDNISLLSLSSNDIYGPRGVGALYVKSGVPIRPILQGGGQERGLRSGTENVAGAVGMGKAAEIAQAQMPRDVENMGRLRGRLIEGILGAVDRAYLNGHPRSRLCNNANVRFSFIEGESLVLALDGEGIQASTSSACTSKMLEPSHVLLAMGVAPRDAEGALLLTLGRGNTAEDVDYVLEKIPEAVKKLRAISPFA